MKQFAKGFLIGVSFTIPGVCSALVAMFLNSYDSMLEVIEKFYNPKIIIKNFLFILGIILGIILCIMGMSLIFENYESILKIFFLGLTIGGLISIIRKTLPNKVVDLLIIMFGILLSLIPEILSQNSTNNFSILVLILGGILSSFAFIMPGISGSLLLLTLGIYQIIIDSFSDIFQIFTMTPPRSSVYNCLIFIISFVIGAIVFAKIIKKIIKKNELIFLKFCLGLLLGTILIFIREVWAYDLNIFFKVFICTLGVLIMKFFSE